MADSKITALASIGTGTDPANDPLVIVDVSDILPGGMSLTGTTKKVTLNNLLACSPTATLASATITGDLTVRTNKLAVTSTGVGAGTASPLSVFTVQSQASARLSVRTTDAVFGTVTGGTALDSLNGSDASLVPFGVRGSTVTLGSSAGIGFQIDASGNATWQNVGGVAGTAMTLNSTGLGIGASPTQALFISRAGAAAIQIVNSSDSINALFGVSTTEAFLTSPNRAFVFNVAGSERLRIDTSGNVGIGVTPSAGKGCLQLSSGINFPATQVASSDANTLDDYEEGNWTGTLSGSTAGPTTPVTAIGKYTKIGRQVSIQIAFIAVDTTGASSRILVTGLPFAASSSPNGITGSVLIDAMATFTGSPGVYLTSSSTQIDLYASVSNGAIASVTHNAGAAKSLWLNVTYTV